MKGDRFPNHVGVKRKKNWLLLDEALLSQHMLIIGTTGAGKTETIKRLVAEVLRATDHDVFLVDGKGDPVFAREIAQLIYEARGAQIPIFSMGTGEIGSVYNGFRGEAADVYNRLCALVGVEEASGDAQYYADINRDILQLVCFSPHGAPRSFEELLQRLDKDWLEKTYASDLVELRNIRTIPDESFGSLLVRIRPLVRELRSVVDPNGFILEEIPGAVFSLRTQSVGDTARRFLRFFVEDIKDFVGKRQQRAGLLIIDEFGAFQSQGIDDILTLARSSNFGVILATQDVANLGEKDMRQIIMANTRTRILHVSDFPEEIAKLAGTKMAVESSIQHEEGEPTGSGSARPQHQFRIDMNEAAQLKAGEGFLIRQRYTAKFRTKRVPEVVATPEAVAEYRKQVTSQRTASPPPRKEQKQSTQNATPKPQIPDLKF
jgi:Cdc6-like AAA superfamily ATPase